jgi:hypothetical protein
MAGRDPWNMVDPSLSPFSWVQRMGSMAWEPPDLPLFSPTPRPQSTDSITRSWPLQPAPMQPSDSGHTYPGGILSSYFSGPRISGQDEAQGPQDATFTRTAATTEGPPKGAAPFGGFVNPSSPQHRYARAEFNDCMKDGTTTSAEVGKGYYEFCTTGRLSPTEQMQNGDIKRFTINGGSQGTDVFGRDRKTGTYARWHIEPGQTLSASVDDSDNITMNIK